MKIERVGADELAETVASALSASTPATAAPTEPTIAAETAAPAFTPADRATSAPGETTAQAETAAPAAVAPDADELAETAATAPSETATSSDTTAPPDAPMDAAVPPESSGPSWASFRNSLGNVLLALLFFVVLIPTQSPLYRSTIATEIWFWGAVMMGVLSLLRVPPRSTMVNPRSILATGAMMVVPALLRPTPPASTGWLAYAAIAIEIVGITYTQVARLYLGRRFGLLPANRGIVSTGPFRWVRHPVYSGWVILTIGYLLAYPNLRNLAMFMLSLPFLIWRMALEEEHLVEDPEYREYLAKTRWRLIPGIY